MKPLAERMRPKTLEDFVGQDHLVGESAVLKRMIDSNTVPSFILWGPPGVGKTTIASILSQKLKRPFYSLSAINSGVKDVRETIAKAENARFFDRANPILFIDEIHRFSKSQQDSLLGAVEKGVVTLIGATTENPSFEVISALLSRCQVYILKPLEKEDLILLVDKALKNDEFLKDKEVKIESYDALLRVSGGDGRKLLNSLEIVVSSFEQGQPINITDDYVFEVIQDNLAKYDKTGEQHYDIISAFIKSIRGSDPNATVYYLGRMIAGGEDPKFICRRMIISASEDVGLANPNALLLAESAFRSIEKIGMPEGRIIMSQVAVYLACSPKSNTSYMAINKVLAAIRDTGDLSVPLHLRNAPTKLMKSIGYGKDYKYSHDQDQNSPDQEYLPEEISGSQFYSPGNNPSEQKLSAVVRQKWKDKYGY
ncbi:MAG: putative ATPase [Saprospiraceae bacterium]|jgi:putative ATPase|tara:strand:- start:178 stop:1452 length:1275 start_codon:yes stop_codon:yes gene_type:complete